MKKLLAFILLAVMALGMCACSNKTKLTTENINDYIKIELSSENLDYQGIPGRSGYRSTTDVVVNVYAKRPGSFDNVIIWLSIDTPNGWVPCENQTLSDYLHDYDELTLVPSYSIPITLHTNGDGQYSLKALTTQISDSPICTLPSCTYSINSVKGTFIKE